MTSGSGASTGCDDKKDVRCIHPLQVSTFLSPLLSPSSASSTTATMPAVVTAFKSMSTHTYLKTRHLNSDPPTLLDLIRKHQNHRQPDSDPQEYTKSPPSQLSQNTIKQTQPPEPATPIEQPTHSHPSPESYTKGEMVATSDGRNPKSNMPTHKGLENFKLVSQMGESVYTAYVSDHKITSPFQWSFLGRLQGNRPFDRGKSSWWVHRH